MLFLIRVEKMEPREASPDNYSPATYSAIVDGSLYAYTVTIMAPSKAKGGKILPRHEFSHHVVIEKEDMAGLYLGPEFLTDNYLQVTASDLLVSALKAEMMQ